MSADTATDTLPAFRFRQSRKTRLLWALCVLLLVSFLLAVGSGAVAIAPLQVLSILAAQVGLELPWEYARREEIVLMAIRLPRAILAIQVGAGLAISGAALQGLFRNPLADPALIGVSAGAALAAVSMIVFGSLIAASVRFLPGAYLLPLAAFAGGLAATWLVYRIANRNGRTDVATMLLAGVAVNAITTAAIGLLIFVSTDQQLRDLNFWLLGGLGGKTWHEILPATFFITVAAGALSLFSRHLNALLLGESEAVHLGFNIEQTKRMIVILVALTTGASVAVTGIIGFVGLVVPHLVRLLIGPDHRTLMPASMLLGAAILLLADLGARTVVLPAELPVGILTSCIGGPFFLWLLLRRPAGGGW
ncbi:MAG TPA: hypothetical protein DCF61_01250 [Alphaproteobacteria bacterium]|nr:hypothetical protein [Alphaproteobacteria bacterium]HBA42556.1 hypothetical protein [Alphaproteobacteria bacterium]HBC53596.1 hypothetical protein [Alphaproteobacteria bacterium]HCO91660.1 hypothetical protein [Alphaproteobacteria bacterium]